MSKKFYMTAVPQEDKDVVIESLKALITEIENSDTMFGLIINYSQVKKVEEIDGDMNIGVKTHNLIAGQRTLIANNLARNLREKEDYQEIFNEVAEFL